ncbi:MAG: hypothetical protein IKB07_09140 [Lachnospiraceae bacterium]|nr:hypothetical protein [Lachnospiraceae bacterium]
MKHKNHKHSNHLSHYLISALALGAILFCITGCSKKTPREALENAYKKTFTQENPKETVLGLSEIKEAQNKDKAHSTGFSFAIQELTNEELGEYAGILSGLGLDIDMASDTKNRKSSALIDVNYGGTTYLSVGGQVNNSKLHLTAPQLLEGSLCVNLQTMNDDLESDSMMAELFDLYDITLPDSTGELITSLITPSSLISLGELASSWNDLDDAIVVETLDKKEVSLPKDISAKTVYRVIIPEEDYGEYMTAATLTMTEAINSLLTNMGIEDLGDVDENELKEVINDFTKELGDIVFIVSVTKDGYINYVTTSFEVDAASFEIEASFTGKKNPLEVVEIVAEAEIDGKKLEFECNESFDSKDQTMALSAEFILDGETLMDFSTEGTYTDIEKGKKYTLDFDYIELSLADLLSVSVAGNYYIDFTECDIPKLSGPEYNLFTMDEEEFSNLAFEIIGNLTSDPLLSGLMELLDIGF